MSERVIITIAVLTATVLVVHPGLVKPVGSLLGDHSVLKEKSADQQSTATQPKPQPTFLGNLPGRAESYVDGLPGQGEEQSPKPFRGQGLRHSP
jgi:hypothetical protein